MGVDEVENGAEATDGGGPSSRPVESGVKPPHSKEYLSWLTCFGLNVHCESPCNRCPFVQSIFYPWPHLFSRF